MNPESILKTFNMSVVAYDTCMRLKANLADRFEYRISLEQNNFLYEPVLGWINAQTDGRRVKLHPVEDGIKSLFDGSDTRVRIKGHVYRVKVSRGGSDSTRTAISATRDYFSSDGASSIGRITFTCGTPGAVKVLEEFMENLREEVIRNDKRIFIKTPSSFDDWSASTMPKRTINSVFLPEGEKESMFADVDDFLSSESRYESIGIPWHRGYLLYGEPGNGKTSIALAMANHYKFSLYSLNLSSVKDDKALTNLVSDIRPNSILLIEDIDIFSKSMDRDQPDDGVTLAGMLNALDGIATPHGLITVITTNRMETLPPALIRPGRVDYRLELKAPDQYQADNMFAHVFGEPLGVKARKFESTAELFNIIKMNLDDPEAVRSLIKGA